MRQSVVSNWELSSYHGWGVYALNLALNWAHDPEVALVCARPVDPLVLAVGAADLQALQPMRRASAQMADQLAKYEGGEAPIQAPVLHAIDKHLVVARAAHDVLLKGRRNFGVVFLESAHLQPEAVARAEGMDLIFAGSSWNEALLRAHGIERAQTVLQGVDPALFHPRPRRGRLGEAETGERFLVFSGGKLERRKGQDLVLAAFRIFAERRPDAVLVTAWHSLWPHIARSLDISGLAAPVMFRPDGQLDVIGWAAANGVPEHQVRDLGLVPNRGMPALLAEMDVALFPNRCEGGTNLVAMEAMACGVPTILAGNTGQLDLIEAGNCYPLTRQRPLQGLESGHGEVGGWGESDVEEIVAALEDAYRDREEARRRGQAGAATLSRMSWAATARAVKAAILARL
ncbi:MAG: mshA 8 [Phenylobacterium sp.]|nr:mshA 8 [Phenylobacterium sp.]